MKEITTINSIGTTLLSSIFPNGVEATAFIIPNLAGYLKDYIIPDSLRWRVQKICDVNNVPFHEDEDKLVQVWIFSTVLNTDNLNDHGAVVTSEDGTKFYIETRCSMIPDSFFKGHKEGDVIDINFPVTIQEYTPKENQEEMEAVMKVKLTLQQGGKRYSNFGTFEEVLAFVTR